MNALRQMSSFDRPDRVFLAHRQKRLGDDAPRNARTNPGKRPLNAREPRPEPALPECPPELSPTAQREWTRLAGELLKLNLITNLDRGALATYCGAYAMWAESMEQIQKYGTMVKSPTGFPIQSPYLSIANRQAEIMMRIASEFGFTPASRSRISAAPQDQLPLFGGTEQEN
jgi:P27 family predicted phage terminase small subunit